MNREQITASLEALKLALLEDGTLTANSSISFTDNVYNKGIYWAGKDYTKQLTLFPNPDRLFTTENIDLQKGKSYQIDGVDVLSGDSLGTSVTKSNLRTVGNLRGLVVEGSVSINQYLYYDGSTDRLGLGTDQPNAALSIAEDGIEVVVGTEDFTKGFVGTFGSNDFLIKTDDTTRMSIKASGDISVAKNFKVSGKVAIGVNTPDPNVDLHVSGPIKFNDKVHLNGSSPPTSGSYNRGDIVWNSEPKAKSFVGWICVQAGNPGTWAAFGEIR